jgi:putative redox protein
MPALSVQHVDGDRFTIGIREHLVDVDQPVGDGGADTAPTPTELFVASLVSCVAFYARRYLARHHLPTTGLTVTTDYRMGSHPARVSDMRIEIALDSAIPHDRREALLAVASHCTVHNTLTQPAAIDIALADSPSPTAPVERMSHATTGT